MLSKEETVLCTKVLTNQSICKLHQIKQCGSLLNSHYMVQHNVPPLVARKLSSIVKEYCKNITDTTTPTTTLPTSTALTASASVSTMSPLPSNHRHLSISPTLSSICNTNTNDNDNNNGDNNNNIITPTPTNNNNLHEHITITQLFDSETSEDIRSNKQAIIWDVDYYNGFSDHKFDAKVKLMLDYHKAEKEYNYLKALIPTVSSTLYLIYYNNIYMLS